MKQYFGKSVFNGIAIGKICVFKKNQQQIKRQKIDNIDEEIKRFYVARDEAINQLGELYNKALKEVGEANAAIFEIHQMMLQDDDYLESVENIVKNQGLNAEYAVSVTSENFATMFAAMDDEYMNAREADVKDISERVISILCGTSKDLKNQKEPVIIVADDLSPSETVQMDKDKVLAFVTVHGTTSSHTAILARTMGIPALVATDITLDDEIDGKTAIVDGNLGYIVVEPDEETLSNKAKELETEKEKKLLMQKLRGQKSETIDGKSVMTYANIGSLKDLGMVLENDAEGIGLFRSEFLYLENSTYPTEEEQLQVYKLVAETMAGRRVIIRTLDIGADKQVDYFEMPQEENPAMGCRAIRICLTRTEIFKTQLRAIYRASAYGKIAIMYPMITSLKEIKKIKEIVEQVKDELTNEGISFGEVEQGIMIETPAAAVISDLLAKEVDFFSIGTNDLTQYLLAIDRQNEQLEEFFDAHHLAVLRMINTTIQNAHQAGIWCGICGELGADTKLTKLFLSMGIDELSVSPASILPIRKIISETHIGNEREEILKQWL